YHKPAALMERYDTFEVRERCLFDGTVHDPLDVADARRVAGIIAERGYEAVAVCFLHAYANPTHEQRMRAVLAEVAPEVEITLSHELSREYREYERTSTAVLDAYIKPIVRRYLQVLGGELAGRGFTGQFVMTRSGGGTMTVDLAREQPVNLILSGPAGGVIGAAALSRLVNEPNLITVDMGGTSLDASLIVDAQPVRYHRAEFEHLPINTSSLYIHTIGAGGGSIAWLDQAGALQVGPQSAGASPGPASYGQGGTEPTFTDAALLLGYLGDDTPLGGILRLDVGLAERALTPVADRLGMSVAAVARGILAISTTKIVGAVRAITVELGHDPKDFALLSFGGGGGLVAVDVARELGIPTVIVPPGQGAFSAFGMLMADAQHDLARTSITPLDEIDLAAVVAAYEEMTVDAGMVLAGEGFPPERRHMARSVDVRYSGQEHTVTVAFPARDADIRTAIREEFARLHERQYGHTMGDPVEITTLRLHATGAVDKPSLPQLAERTNGTPECRGTREVTVSGDGQRLDYALYAREGLLAGDVVTGPAVIAEHTATTVVHTGDLLRVGQHGEMVVTIATERSAGKRERP
ncbi:MAG TPA: hydantoinase/oxoprolinase family protein, partial [Actinopolymorphaceae bacterium]|nr:hydantoinase/oxoprolinase family protein [Actinopolymorphaceae bacterium]